MKEAVSATTIIPVEAGLEAAEAANLLVGTKIETCNVCNTLVMALEREKERNSQLEAAIRTLNAKVESYEAMILTMLNSGVSQFLN